MQHVLQTCPRAIQVKVISSLYGFEQGIGDMIKTIWLAWVENDQSNKCFWNQTLLQLVGPCVPKTSSM